MNAQFVRKVVGGALYPECDARLYRLTSPISSVAYGGLVEHVVTSVRDAGNGLLSTMVFASDSEGALLSIVPVYWGFSTLSVGEAHQTLAAALEPAEYQAEAVSA
jgi:hypothetical protein